MGEQLETLRSKIKQMLEFKLGMDNVLITEREWSTAMEFALKDGFANRILLGGSIDPAYFRQVMVDSLALLKRQQLN